MGIVRWPVPDPDASRDDDRGARGAVQRRIQHCRVIGGRPYGRVDARHVCRCHGPSVGDAVAEHAHAGHGDRVSGYGAIRGNDALGRTRDDAAVRARGRALD